MKVNIRHTSKVLFRDFRVDSTMVQIPQNLSTEVTTVALGTTLQPSLAIVC